MKSFSSTAKLAFAFLAGLIVAASMGLNAQQSPAATNAASETRIVNAIADRVEALPVRDLSNPRLIDANALAAQLDQAIAYQDFFAETILVNYPETQRIFRFRKNAFEQALYMVESAQTRTK